MLSRYRKIKEDSRFSAAEDRGHYPVCGDSAAKLTSFISFYLLLSPFIYKEQAKLAIIDCLSLSKSAVLSFDGAKLRRLS